MLVAGRGVLKNHILTVNEAGKMQHLTALIDELAYTIYVSEPMAVICASDTLRFNEVFKKATDASALIAAMNAEAFTAVKQGSTISIFKTDFKEHYIEKLL